MICPDVKDKIPHGLHWHVVMADGIVIAQGTCYGYAQDAGLLEWHRGMKFWRAWQDWLEPEPWYKRFYYFWSGKHFAGIKEIREEKVRGGKHRAA